jgi:hypothetical protein
MAEGELPPVQQNAAGFAAGTAGCDVNDGQIRRGIKGRGFYAV